MGDDRAVRWLDGTRRPIMPLRVNSWAEPPLPRKAMNRPGRD